MHTHTLSKIHRCLLEWLSDVEQSTYNISNIISCSLQLVLFIAVRMMINGGESSLKGQNDKLWKEENIRTHCTCANTGCQRVTNVILFSSLSFSLTSHLSPHLFRSSSIQAICWHRTAAPLQKKRSSGTPPFICY